MALLTIKCNLEHFAWFPSPHSIQGRDTEVIRVIEINIMQHVIIDIADVLYFPVPVIYFVLKNEHSYGTVPVIPFTPGDV